MDQYTPFLTGMLLRRGFSADDTADLVQRHLSRSSTTSATSNTIHASDSGDGWPRLRAQGLAAHAAARRRDVGHGGTTNCAAWKMSPGDCGASVDDERRLSIVLGQLRARVERTGVEHLRTDGPEKYPHRRGCQTAGNRGRLRPRVPIAGKKDVQTPAGGTT